MKEKLEHILRVALKEIGEASSLQGLEEARVKFLGRKAALTEILRSLSELPPDERPVIGMAANKAKQEIAAALEQSKGMLETRKAEAEAKAPPIDLSLPGRRRPVGHMHAIWKVTEEIISIFSAMGFQVATGPDVETEYYNFDSLNTPSNHPSRDLHATFFVKPGVVLRTHTSPVKMRAMEACQPPIAIVAPGRVYRVDIDASHSPMFFQIEGLLVDKGVSFADLKGSLLLFIHRFFGPETKIRFRPHYFPFTEPSAEVDISCSVCNGQGCRVCKHSGWLEILGCGMVHPQVLRYARYDDEKYTGYAFGMGIDRIAMLKYAVDNIQHFYENDLRFLQQF